MEYIISENQLKKLLQEAEFDPKIEKIQKYLVYDKKYDLGNYGPKRDGVDGILGPKTKQAIEKELNIKLEDPVVISKTYGGSQSTSSYGAMLVGGLDYRSSDLSTPAQGEMLQNSIGTRVKTFRYSTDNTTIEQFLEQNPNIPIYLFSAGCTKAAILSRNPNVDKQKLYIIEPYGVSDKTREIVRTAVANGVPAKNVFVGKHKGVGLGIVSGASSSNSPSHFGALKSVGSMTT